MIKYNINQFGLYCNKCLAIDLDEVKIDFAKNNSKIYESK